MKLKIQIVIWFKSFDQFLQCGEDKECCEVDLYHHVHIVVSKDLAHVGQHDEDGGGDEHGENVSDEGPPKDENDNQSCPIVSKSGGADPVVVHKVLRQVHRSLVRQVSSHKDDFFRLLDV